MATPPPSTYPLDPTDPDLSSSFPAVDADFLAALPADPDLDLDALTFDFDFYDFDLDLDPSPNPSAADFHPSPESGNSGGDSSGSAVVDNPSGPPIGSNSKSEAGGLKRKVEGEDGVAKAARVGGSDEEGGRRRARLLRNRESAQLSRQRKKQYVEELEEKVRSMNSTIAELRGRLSFSLAENTSLRHQLFATAGAAGGTGGVVHPPGAVHYPWYPAAPLIVAPQGYQVPLLPIPRIRPSPSKKSVKTKKVASVSLLGVLFFLLVFGGLVPFVNVRFGSVTLVTSLSRLNYGNGVVVNGNDRSRDRVLSVREQKVVSGMEQDRQDGSSWKPSNASSEPLLASLYVPRNNKMVKIDGNLIIHSALASEKAAASEMAVASEKAGGGEKIVSERKDGRGESTGLVVHGDLRSALVVSNGRCPHNYRGSSEKLGELGSDSWDKYGDAKGLSASEAPLQQWFREGLAGPIMSSGMCTEVFRFEVSSNPAAIVSASSVRNTSNSNPGYTPRKMKNRRILYSPMPLHNTSLNKTNETPPEPTIEGKLQGNSSASTSMVVSVLLDPNEAGDIESVASSKSKSLSRIFVVVLLDSVKYVTYSCVLPIKGSGPHLVRN